MSHDDEYRSGLRDLERRRQEEWQSNAEYHREMLEDMGAQYDELAGEAQLDEWAETGKSQRDRELEQYAEGSMERDAFLGWEDAIRASLERENDAERMDLERSHNIKSAEDAVRRALNIERQLKEDPGARSTSCSSALHSPARPLPSSRRPCSAIWSRSTIS